MPDESGGFAGDLFSARLPSFHPDESFDFPAEDLVSLENQMIALREQRDLQRQATWDKVKGVRSMVKVV